MRIDLDDLTEAASNLSEGERLFREELGAENYAPHSHRSLPEAGRVIEASDVAFSANQLLASSAARTKAFSVRRRARFFKGYTWGVSPNKRGAENLS